MIDEFNRHHPEFTYQPTTATKPPPRPSRLELIDQTPRQHQSQPTASQHQITQNPSVPQPTTSHNVPPSPYEATDDAKEPATDTPTRPCDAMLQESTAPKTAQSAPIMQTKAELSNYSHSCNAASPMEKRLMTVLRTVDAAPNTPPLCLSGHFTVTRQETCNNSQLSNLAICPIDPPKHPQPAHNMMDHLMTTTARCTTLQISNYHACCIPPPTNKTTPRPNKDPTLPTTTLTLTIHDDSTMMTTSPTRMPKPTTTINNDAATTMPPHDTTTPPTHP